MKTFLSVILSLLIVSAVNSSNFKFLDDTAMESIKLEKGEISFKLDCEPGLPIKHIAVKANPTSVIKGEPINFKGKVETNSKVTVSQLIILAKLNNEDAFDAKKDIVTDIVPGTPFLYSYDITVPTYVPSGKFDIFLYLIDKDGKHLSCLNAQFDY